MKKSLLNIAMALCIGLFAACSQEEIISPSNGEVETVSIDAQLPQTVGTRALPGAAEGHQLRCILEVWDKAAETLITRIEKLVTPEDNTAGKLQFSFSVGKDVTYQCLLWADFIANNAGTSTTADGNTKYADKYFNTTSLKEIDFAVGDASLFNNASADAFCAAVDKNGTTSSLSVTLKRPFTKVTLTDKTDYITGCTGFEVAYNTPSGYNIATQETTTTKAVNATRLQINGKTWFSTFIFASTGKKTLDEDIIMTVTTAEGTDTKTIKRGQITLDPNKENNAEATFSDDEDVKIEVDVDSDYPDPNALKIGQFVNKDGTIVDAYSTDAIGIVFAAAKGKTDTSNYGEAFAGKKIAGYAMALTGTTTRYNLQSDTDADGTAFPVKTTIPGDFSWTEEDYNGYDYTQTLINGLGEYASPVFEAYNELVKQSTGANNLSAWYIPSARQLLQIVGMLYPGKEDLPMHGVTTNADFKESYDAVIAANPSAPYKIDCGRNGATNIFSSSFKDSKIYAVQTTLTNSILSNISSFPIKTQFPIRPVLTIFKK